MKKTLAEHSPELLLEWHPTKNTNVTPHSISCGSAQNVWWLCAEGHEWKATINHRTQGRGCPECAQIKRSMSKRKNIVEKRGSLADKNPELALEWHPTKNGDLTPYGISSNSPERV